MKKLTKKNIIITFILLFFTVILAFSIYFCVSYIKDNQYWFNQNSHIPTSKKDTYIIQNVDDILITNYISKKQNTLVVFWASWCSSCVEEANELNNFINNNPDIPVLIVSFDKNITDLENYLSANSYNWFVIFDTERKIRQSLDTDTKGIPAVYLLDSNMNVISKEISSMNEVEFLNFYNLKK